ncbi:hypothetical protein RIF29_00157 [Crotalaria pallida]|uniref:Aldo/keto reductase n=1 Tax=Crotalaria pallida TaxID=3830 RepID=A0AAN9IX71_CROPI
MPLLFSGAILCASPVSYVFGAHEYGADDHKEVKLTVSPGKGKGWFLKLNSLCRELGIGIVAYSPLGCGFFAGKGAAETLPSQSLLVMHPRFNGENLEKNKLFYK